MIQDIQHSLNRVRTGIDVNGGRVAGNWTNFKPDPPPLQVKINIQDNHNSSVSDDVTHSKWKECNFKTEEMLSKL